MQYSQNFVLSQTYIDKECYLQIFPSLKCQKSNILTPYLVKLTST